MWPFTENRNILPLTFYHRNMHPLPISQQPQIWQIGRWKGINIKACVWINIGGHGADRRDDPGCIDASSALGGRPFWFSVFLGVYGAVVHIFGDVRPVDCRTMHQSNGNNWQARR